jgi:hypothetical protein
MKEPETRRRTPDAEGGGGPPAGEVPNEREAAAVFPHGDERPLREQTRLTDDDGDDVRQYTGEPVETEEGIVIPQQSVTGSQEVVGGGEFPTDTPVGDDDTPAADDGPSPRDPSRRDIERLDPDSPGRSMFEEGGEANEPNEPA